MEKKYDADQFAEEFGQNKIEALEKELALKNRQIEMLTARQREVKVVESGENTIRFGVTGDWHYGSLWHDQGAISGYFDLLKREGINRVYCAGDILEGHGMYKGQEFEVRDAGLDLQLERAKADAPTWGDVHFVTGNHDESFYKENGAPVGKLIEGLRENWTCIGRRYADVEYSTPNGGRFKVGLMHPAGGSSYALCFSPDTEILSADGWVAFPKLKNGVPVATLNRDTRNFEWQIPTDYTIQDYDGDLLAFEGFHYNFRVTPDHRFFARRPWDRWNSTGSNGKKKNISWQMVKAKNISGRDWVIPKSCNWSDGVDPVIPPKISNDPMAFAELIGWYISEGSRSKANRQIQIDQANRSVLREIAALARKCGYNPYERKDCGRIVITARHLYNWIDESCPGTAFEKRVPPQFMNATKPFLTAFLNGYLRGDGAKTNRGWHSCVTVSPGLADDIQEIALKLGYCACIKKQPGRSGNKINGTVVASARERYQISFNYKILEPALSSPVRVPHKGNVYCVSVPNEIIMVRRDGKCAWSGNSYRPQKIIEQISGGRKPNMLVVGHFHEAELMPAYRNVVVVQSGTFQSQTPFMQEKGLAAHIGGWIFEITVAEKDALHNRIKAEFIPFYEW